MNIDTLQIKRVTDNWDTHKTFVPAIGELVLISVDDELPVIKGFVTGSGEWRISTKDMPIIVIGDGKSSLRSLVTPTSNRMFLSNNILRQCITKLTSHTENPPEISSASSIGVSTTAAKSDHTHGLPRDIVEKSLGMKGNAQNNFYCRRVCASSTDAPDPNLGVEGDIYIQYKL